MWLVVAPPGCADANGGCCALASHHLKVLHPEPWMTSLCDTLPNLVGIFSTFLFAIPADLLVARGREPVLHAKDVFRSLPELYTAGRL